MPGTELPERFEDDGTSIRVVIGDYRGVKSPVEGIAADPQYLDVFVPAGKRKTFKVDTRRRAFAYVFDGAGSFRDAARPEGVLLEKEVTGKEVNIRDLSGNRTLVRFGAGDEVTVTAGPDGVRFLLISRRADRRAGGLGRADRDEHARPSCSRRSRSCATGPSSARRIEANRGFGARVDAGAQQRPRQLSCARRRRLAVPAGAVATGCIEGRRARATATF